MSQRRILSSWKEISQYLGRGVRTVQRYEVELGLPVRRVAGKRRTAVMAYADEIDQWLNRSAQGAASEFIDLEPAAAGENSDGHSQLAVQQDLVYIIEDHVADLDLLRSALNRIARLRVQSYSEAHSAIAALQLVVAGKGLAPRLIVLDYELRESTGLDVLRFYRSHPKLKHTTTVVVWSVLDSSTTRELSTWLGAEAFIPKQGGLELLDRALRKVLQPALAAATN